MTLKHKKNAWPIHEKKGKLKVFFLRLAKIKTLVKTVCWGSDEKRGPPIHCCGGWMGTTFMESNLIPECKCNFISVGLAHRWTHRGGKILCSRIVLTAWLLEQRAEASPVSTGRMYGTSSQNVLGSHWKEWSRFWYTHVGLATIF